MAGNAGRYRSSENGPSKEIAPSSNRSLDITGGLEVIEGARDWVQRATRLPVE
jgi:hypothetical protein